MRSRAQSLRDTAVAIGVRRRANSSNATMGRNRCAIERIHRMRVLAVEVVSADRLAAQGTMLDAMGVRPELVN
jgi:hypothetical protein